MTTLPIGAKVTADTTQFVSGMQAATHQLSRFRGAAGLAGAAIAGLAGAAGLALAVDAAKDFETEILRLNTLVGLSAEETDEMSQAIMRLSTEIGALPSEMAKAAFTITSGGARGSQAIEILEASAKAAAIGLGNMEEIGRTAGAAVQAFGAQGLTAAEAVDILVGTVRAGNLAAEELAPSMGRVMGIAAQMGVSMNEVGAFIATYTRLGLSAAEATTGLRSTLVQLLNPTQQAREALATIGYTADEIRTSIRERGLNETLIELLDAMQGNMDIIGTAIPNVRALAAVLGTAGVQAESLTQITKDMEQIVGTTAESFGTFEESAEQAFRRVSANFERIKIELGREFLPAVADAMNVLADNLDDVVRVIQFIISAGVAVGLARFAAGLKGAAVAAGGLGASISGAVAALGGIVGVTAVAAIGIGMLIDRMADAATETDKAVDAWNRFSTGVQATEFDFGEMDIAAMSRRMEELTAAQREARLAATREVSTDVYEKQEQAVARLEQRLESATDTLEAYQYRGRSGNAQAVAEWERRRAAVESVQRQLDEARASLAGMTPGEEATRNLMEINAEIQALREQMWLASLSTERLNELLTQAREERARLRETATPGTEEEEQLALAEARVKTLNDEVLARAAVTAAAGEQAGAVGELTEEEKQAAAARASFLTGLRDQVEAMELEEDALIRLRAERLNLGDAEMAELEILLDRLEAAKEIERVERDRARAERERQRARKQREQEAARALQQAAENAARLRAAETEAELNQIKDAAQRMAESVGEAIMEMNLSFEGLLESVRNVVAGILDELAKLIIRKQVTEPILAFFEAALFTAAGAGGSVDYGFGEGVGPITDVGIPGMNPGRQEVSGIGGTQNFGGGIGAARQEVGTGVENALGDMASATGRSASAVEGMAAQTGRASGAVEGLARDAAASAGALADLPGSLARSFETVLEPLQRAEQALTGIPGRMGAQFQLALGPVSSAAQALVAQERSGDIFRDALTPLAAVLAEQGQRDVAGPFRDALAPVVAALESQNRTDGDPFRDALAPLREALDRAGDVPDTLRTALADSQRPVAAALDSAAAVSAGIGTQIDRAFGPVTSASQDMAASAQRLLPALAEVLGPVAGAGLEMAASARELMPALATAVGPMAGATHELTRVPDRLGAEFGDALAPLGGAVEGLRRVPGALAGEMEAALAPMGLAADGLQRVPGAMALEMEGAMAQMHAAAEHLAVMPGEISRDLRGATSQMHKAAEHLAMMPGDMARELHGNTSQMHLAAEHLALLPNEMAREIYTSLAPMRSAADALLAIPGAVGREAGRDTEERMLGLRRVEEPQLTREPLEEPAAPQEPQVVVQQNVTFAPSFIDGADGERWLQTQRGSIVRIVGEAAQQSLSVARMLQGRRAV